MIEDAHVRLTRRKIDEYAKGEIKVDKVLMAAEFLTSDYIDEIVAECKCKKFPTELVESLEKLRYKKARLEKFIDIARPIVLMDLYNIYVGLNYLDLLISQPSKEKN